MPFVEHKVGREFNTFERPAEERADPSLGDTFSAAWHLENDVANVLDMMSRPTFTPQEGFRVGPKLRDYDTENRTDLFEKYRWRFMGVQSEDEMLHTIGRIREQEMQRDTLQRSGALGIVAGVSAGLVSPTTFIPFLAGGRGLAAVARGAASGFAAAVPAELALYANQETRTEGELAFGLGASTALGGILGGAVSALRKGESAIFEEELMKVAKPGGLSADVVNQFEDAGGLASGARTVATINDKTRVFTNPVTQTINQTEYESFRVLMQQLSDSGLRMSKNEDFIPASPGGTIENRLHYYTGMLVKGDEGFDESYAKYFFDGDTPSFAPNVRASLGGTFNANGKLSAGQFADEVTRAIFSGFQHQVPEVAQAAQKITKDIYEPLLKLAQEAKLLPDDVKVVGDEAYVNRVYNTRAIKTHTQEFIDILTQHRQADLEQQFADDLEKFKGKQAQREELVEDLNRPESEVDELLTKFREELNAIEETLPEEIQQLEEAISTNRATARAMRMQGMTVQDEAVYKQLLRDARDMEQAGGEEFAKIKGARQNLRRRLRNLNKAVVAVDAKRAAKIDRIEKTEELEIKSLMRLVGKAQTTLRKLDRWSDAKLDKEVSKLKDAFAKTGEVFDRGEETLTRLGEADADLHRIGALEDVQRTREHRLDEISQRLESAEGLDRAAIRATIQEGLTETLTKVQGLNTRRVLRTQRLRQEVAKLDPSVVEARLKEASSMPSRAAGDFARRWEMEYGADAVDLDKGIADFAGRAKQEAQAVTDKIIGTYTRLPYSEVMQMERGAELRRVLHIPSLKVDKFLEKDIRKLSRSYVRTLGPDIELMNKFKSLNMSDWIGAANDERYAKIERLNASKPENVTSEAWEKKVAKETLKINEDFELHKRNVEAVVNRLRGTRGLPSDPDGFAYRAGRTIMNLNVLRMMGMVAISSLPDLARPVMRYGLTRTFKDGFMPLISGLKNIKIAQREAKLAGVATDVSATMRAMAMRDITDELQTGTKAERAIEWATNRMGNVALFQYWTQAGELLTSSITNAKLMDSLAQVNTGKGNLSAKAAETFLAENGITSDLASRMWKEITENGGGAKTDGVWWPDTELWKDQTATRAYRSALAREVTNTIIRPGVERPLIADANMTGRMLYQFKSFGMAAMPKLVMAGAQQRDMAALSGSLASLGMGALSYYLWAVASGGKAYTEMMNADIDKWADEAINRAGLLGSLSEVQRIAQTIPLFEPIASFSGTRQTRRPGDDFAEALLGPSFDFLQNATGVIAGLDQPTQGTLRQLRRLAPFQNTFIIRNAIDAAEAAAAQHLPERRQ